jgi:hypothetical protein
MCGDAAEMCGDADGNVQRCFGNMRGDDTAISRLEGTVSSWVDRQRGGNVMRKCGGGNVRSLLAMCGNAVATCRDAMAM